MRHPAPAAVCESKGWQGTELLAVRARSQVERGEVMDNSEGGNPTSKLFLTSDWHFSSGCKEIIREIKLDQLRSKEWGNAACGEYQIWMLTAVLKR